MWLNTLLLALRSIPRNLMRSWADANAGHYAFPATHAEMERSFERMSTRLRRPALYTLTAATAFEDRSPGTLAVTAPQEGAVPLAPAQDFKRLGDGDVGPNTGGMGAYSPVPGVGPEVVDLVMDRAVEPTLAALRTAGIDYRGVLYAGLMLTPEGPKVIEYNVRFGDPEAQVVLPRVAGDLAGLLAGAAAGTMGAPPEFRADAAVTVVLAAEGYPASPRTGDRIQGFEAAAAHPEVTVFAAGVAEDDAGHLVTAGGRVLAVTGAGSTVGAARDRAYAAAAEIDWPGLQMRTDIAASAADGPPTAEAPS